jgi:hypothetical protein
MKKIRNMLRKWLGIEENSTAIQINKNTIKDLVSIGVDVHFKEPHMVLIYSKLKGGQIKHIPVGFENIQDLENLIDMLRCKYKTDSVVLDVPHGYTGFFHRKFGNTDWRR